ICDLQHQRRFANPRLSADEDERPFDHPAAKKAVELAHASANTPALFGVDLADAKRPCAFGFFRFKAGLGLFNRSLFDKRIPVLAAGTASRPFQLRVAALTACPKHFRLHAISSSIRWRASSAAFCSASFLEAPAPLPKSLS